MNDVDAVQGILLDRVGVELGCITRLVSPRAGAVHDGRVESRLPTLANIQGELARLGSDAIGASDRVFVYYSGHGTQLVLKDAGGRRYPREALLPKDKQVGPTYRFLLDWQLNEAIGKIAERCESATVVLDCCSSGGATRAAAGDGEARFFRIEPEIAIESLEAAVPPAAGVRGVAQAVMRHVDRCQVVAAAQADEQAREAAGGAGKHMGHLTRSLCALLEELPPAELRELRWGRIWRTLEAKVLELEPSQHPWLSGGFARRVFGGDVDTPSDVGIGVVAQGDVYELAAGSVSGVTPNAQLAVYGPEPLQFHPLGSGADVAARKGLLHVIASQPATSTARALSPVTLEPGARARLVAPGDAAKLTVALHPDDAGLSRALDDMPHVQLLPPGSAAELVLERFADGWALVDDGHAAAGGGPGAPPVLARIPLGAPALARQIVEHYHAYSAPLRLARSLRELPKLASLALLDCSGAALAAHDAQALALPEAAPGVGARYEVRTGDKLCFEVQNASRRRLYATLLDVAASGKVIVLAHQVNVPPESSERIWFRGSLGMPFEASLPHGSRVGLDRIVVAASTRPGVDLGHLANDTSFVDILTRSARRDRGAAERGDTTHAAPLLEEWTADLITVRVVAR